MNNLVTLFNSFNLLISLYSYFRPLSSDFNGVFVINCGSNIAGKAVLYGLGSAFSSEIVGLCNQ